MLNIKDEIKKGELSYSKYKIGVPIFIVISCISIFFIKNYMPIESQAGRTIVIIFWALFCIWVTKKIVDSIYNKD